MGISLSRLPFSATMRMINWIHHHTADMRSAAFPTRATGLPDGNILMIQIPDLPHRRHAGTQNASHLTRLQANLNIGLIATHDLSETTGAPNELPALSWLQLDVLVRG